MTNNDPTELGRQNTDESVVRFVAREYKAAIYLIIAGLLGLIGYWISTDPSVTIPPVVWDFVLATAGLTPIMLPAFYVLLRRWRSTPKVHVMEINPVPLDPDEQEVYLDDEDLPREAKRTMEPHVIPRQTWVDRDDVEFAPLPWSDAGETDYVVRRLEETNDGLRVWGFSRALEDAVEPVMFDALLRETYNDLVYYKQGFQALKATIRVNRVDDLSRTLTSVVEAVERGTALDPESLDGTLRDRLPESLLGDPHPSSSRDIPDVDELRQDPEQRRLVGFEGQGGQNGSNGKNAR